MRKGCLLFFYFILIFNGTAVQSQVTILSEGFNGAIIPMGWSKINNSSGGTNPAAADWTLRTDGYHYLSDFLDEIFHSNDLTQFYLSNSDEQGDDPAPYNTNTIIQTPDFSTVAYTTLVLKFYHNFWSSGPNDTALVEISTDGTSWTPVYTAHENFNFEIGSSDNFVLQSVNLTAYVGFTNVSIRFHYLASYGNYWAIDNVSVIGNPPLSVTMLSFSGYRDGNKNVLKWTTTNEQNNRGFQVERSTDGINYTATGFVNSLAPAGNSSGSLHYTFNDNNLTGNKHHYRLRQFDLDGREKLSSIVLIKGFTSFDFAINSLFPNPASNAVNIILVMPERDDIVLEIIDMKGRLINRQKQVAEMGSNTIPLDITNLVRGNYLLKISSVSGNRSVTGKFTKQ